jgi:hypothetical protein
MRKVSAERKLCVAAEKGELAKVRKLLAGGANIHASNEAALIKASGRGRLEVVKYLLERDGERADIHAGNDLAVREAALKNRWDVVRYLVKEGANIAVDDYLVWCRSVLHGDPDTVRCLLENGVEVHLKNDWALEAAALNGRQDNVMVLCGWIFRDEAWQGRIANDVYTERERLAGILENSVSVEDCKEQPVEAGAMVGAAAAVALIMDYSSALAKRLSGPRK